jgi:Tfp pilus assembly protein PilF
MAVYKSLERQGHQLRAAAATNLSFLHLLSGDLAAAASCTDLALKADRCVRVCVCVRAHVAS